MAKLHLAGTDHPTARISKLIRWQRNTIHKLCFSSFHRLRNFALPFGFCVPDSAVTSNAVALALKFQLLLTGTTEAEALSEDVLTVFLISCETLVSICPPGVSFSCP